MKNRKHTAPHHPKKAGHVAQSIPVQPLIDHMAYNYALYLMNGKPNPRGRKPTKVKPPLYWLPKSK